MTTSNMIDSMYREEILDHYKNPLNYGTLKQFDVSSKQLNPFCGDEIEMFLKFKQRNSLGGDTNQPPRLIIIANVGFVGLGCAISIASASLLTEYIKGKKKKAVQKFSENDMMTLLNIDISETRKKCVLLAWSALKNCL